MASALPPTLKSLQHYMKIAGEHDRRNAVVAYYARMYVAQQGIKIDAKSPDARTFLIGLMDSLETTKKANAATNEAFKDDIVAQALIEEYVLKLFAYADAEDRAERFNKNVIKAFYTAGMLMDVLTQFSELSEEVQHKRKYAKWKAAHIHACLKNGEKPHAGPVGWEGEEEEEEGEEGAAGGAAINQGATGFSAPPDSSSYSNPADNYSAPYQPPPGGGYGGAAGGYGGAAGGGFPQQNNYSWPDANYPSSSAPPAPNNASSYSAPSAGEVAAAAAAASEAAASTVGLSGVVLSPADIQQAQKLMKFASSALNFEDVPTAIDNCEKALRLLKTGKE